MIVCCFRSCVYDLLLLVSHIYIVKQLDPEFAGFSPRFGLFLLAMMGLSAMLSHRGSSKDRQGAWVTGSGQDWGSNILTPYQLASICRFTNSTWDILAPYRINSLMLHFEDLLKLPTRCFCSFQELVGEQLLWTADGTAQKDCTFHFNELCDYCDFQ